MKTSVIAVAAATASFFAIPARASADVLLTPFAGVTFTEDIRKVNYGASVALGSLIGVEFDISKTRLGSFNDVPLVSVDADATTIMGNLMVRFPAGPVQPYASAGIGVIRISADLDVPSFGEIVDASAQNVGTNVGGGVYLFPSRNIGIRGDFRYFRTLGDVDWEDITDIDDLDDLPLPAVDFWRATVGVTIRF
jgi:opacity protein-like surface antigen